MDVDEKAFEARPLTVRGPRGTVDLLVPSEATALDAAREYAARCGLSQAPALSTLLGVPLRPGDLLTALGPGDQLVAAGEVTTPSPPTPVRVPPQPVLAAGVAVGAATALAVLAVVAAWEAPKPFVRLVIVLLAAAAVGCALPLAPQAAPRRAAAPAFAALATALPLAGADPVVVVGAAALVAAATAAGARVLADSAEEALRVWIVGGGLLAATCGTWAASGWPAQALWSVLVVLAVLVARGAPALVVGARDEAFDSAGETLVGLASAVAARGTRLLVAVTAAVWVSVLIGAPLLARTAVVSVDRAGALALVGLAGAGLLLTARCHRRPAPRRLLTGAGLTCWAALAPSLLTGLTPVAASAVALAGAGLAGLLVAATVASRHGHRSPWRARLAEIGEDLASTGALAALVVAVGLFRTVRDLGFT